MTPFFIQSLKPAFYLLKREVLIKDIEQTIIFQELFKHREKVSMVILKQEMKRKRFVN